MISLDNQDLKARYEVFRQSGRYVKRRSQARFIEIAREVLVNLAAKEAISNTDLTALINMFAYGAKKETFRRNLLLLRFPDELEKKIFDKYIEIGEMGFTGVGLAAIKNLNDDQLAAVRMMLKSVAEAQTVSEIKRVVDEYGQKHVPHVTRGIYSPWLYYLQPKICPLLTGNIMGHLYEKGLERKPKYSQLIDIFEAIKKNVGEDNLGLIDSFLRESEEGSGNGGKETSFIKDNARSLANLKNQIILYGPPGTGKTFVTKRIALSILKDKR